MCEITNELTPGKFEALYDFKPITAFLEKCDTCLDYDIMYNLGGYKTSEAFFTFLQGHFCVPSGECLHESERRTHSTVMVR